MKTIFALILCLIAWFCIMVFSCEQQKPQQVISTGVVWNYANASQQDIFDQPNYRTEGEDNLPPDDQPPVFLAEPCVDYWGAVWLWNETGKGPYERPCSQCHCDYAVPRAEEMYCVRYDGGDRYSWRDCIIDDRNFGMGTCKTITSRVNPGGLPYESNGHF